MSFENIRIYNMDKSFSLIDKPTFLGSLFLLLSVVIPLILFDTFKQNLDLNYIKYSIEVEAKKEGF